MTRQLHPHTPRAIPADGLCACNCGQPALPGFAFASETCRKRVNRRTYKEAHPDKIPNKCQDVIIHDPQLVEPYKESMYFYTLYKADLQRMGCRVEFVGGS
jgi:hypothetical protein